MSRRGARRSGGERQCSRSSEGGGGRSVGIDGHERRSGGGLSGSGGGGGGKPVSSGIITILGDQLAALESEYANLAPARETWWGLGDTIDDDAGRRSELKDQIDIARAQLNYALSSNGVPIPSTQSLGAVRANISDPSK